MTEHIIAIQKIFAKHQITIPKEVRESFRFKEGDMLLFIEKDGDLILRKQ